jgi:hypothetical protein
MDQFRDDLEFRRLAIGLKIEKYQHLIAQYRDGIDIFRGRMDTCNQLLGHLAERLDKPEPEEPR